MSTKIYIDADACPVKDEAVQVARRHGLSVFIVSNGGLQLELEVGCVVTSDYRCPAFIYPASFRPPWTAR